MRTDSPFHLVEKLRPAVRAKLGHDFFGILLAALRAGELLATLADLLNNLKVVGTAITLVDIDGHNRNSVARGMRQRACPNFEF